MTWRAVLDGDDRERAWRTIHAIVADLREPPDDTDVDALVLFNGQPGAALVLAAVARATNDAALAELAAERIAGVAARAVDEADNLYFLSGLTGVVWTIERVNELLGGDLDGDPHAEIDDAVLALLAEPHASPRFELMKGIAGLGVYALSRRRHASARRCLDRVVILLDGMAERSAAGASWLTPAAHMPPDDAARSPNGLHMLGTLHGCLGPIAVLAGARMCGVADAIAGPLLEAAVAWLWAQRREDPRGRFAVAPELDVATTQGWCHGDPGTAAVLFAAACAVGRDDWKALAVSLAREVAARPVAAADAMLCHGASGVGHVLDRIYQATGDATLGAAARAWLVRAMDQLRIDRSYRGLVDGSAGVGLALLAAVGDDEPAWDRALVMAL